MIVAYCVPVSPGRSRVLARFPAIFLGKARAGVPLTDCIRLRAIVFDCTARVSAPAQPLVSAIIKVTPQWATHQNQLTVLEDECVGLTPSSLHTHPTTFTR